MKKILLVVLLIQSQVNAQVSQSERDALVKFFYVTNGPKWTNSSNWNTLAPVSTWFGITTTKLNEEEHVYTINLYNNNLSGTIPVDIIALKELVLLNLPSNKLTGILPYQIQIMPKLNFISVDGNDIAYENQPVESNPVIVEQVIAPKVENHPVKLESFIKNIDVEGFLLGKDALNQLDEISKLMQNDTLTQYTIDVYTKIENDQDQNLNLSKTIAKSVKDYFVSKGVTASRLETKGNGEIYQGSSIKNFLSDKDASRIVIQLFKGDLEEYRNREKLEQEKSQIVEEKPEPIPLASVSESPIYKGCVGDNNELKKCFIDSVNKLIDKKFNEEVAQDLGLEKGSKKISVKIIIDTNGNISEVLVRSPHQNIENEVKRVMALIPNMRPGRHEGKTVEISYFFQIEVNIKS